MLEQELKLHLPAAAQAAVLKQLAAQAGPRRMRLRAMYFDTVDRQLGRQLAALRLRQEGRRWVQTFKMAGADTLSRFELNHARPGPVLDLSVYAGTPVANLIAALQGELVVRYETDVMRLTREVRLRAGVVEVACDIGQIRAGELSIPISEVEFELLRGRPVALFTLAARWHKAHGLALDLRSKAERGDALAEAWLRQPEGDDRKAQALARYAAPRRQAPVTLRPQASADDALRRVTSECLDQMNRNGLLVQGVDGLALTPAQLAEAVHQWRIGLRRLRSAWKCFEGVTALPPETWRAQARLLFNAVGAGRDEHVLHAEILPALQAAGMPDLPPASTTDEPAQTPAQVLQKAGFAAWLLQLYQWTVVQAEAAAEAPQLASKSWPEDTATPPTLAGGAATHDSAVSWVGPLLTRLRKWHRRLVRDGRRFHRLTDDERHELRKLGKRLRYNLQFAEALLPARRLKPYKAQLAVVQDVLGEINDWVTAREVLRARATTTPEAWFGVGWLTAALEPKYEHAAAQFRKLEALKPFWGKRLG